MPQKSEDLPPNWEKVDRERRHIPLNCPWTITSANGTLTVVITCLKWTFNYDFWIKVTAYSEGNPHISKQLDIKSITRCLNPYQKLSTNTTFLSPICSPINFILLENYYTPYPERIYYPQWPTLISLILI